MKRIFCLILLCGAFAAGASTSITTAAVSGHWVITGSPYLIYNDVSVDSSSSLIIDAGVSVIFQGAYSLNVYGSLYAAGTAAQPIIFNVNDTTGWWDSSVAAGGWHGIQFQPFGGAGVDASLLQYCNISYTKFDAADAIAIPALTTLYVQRALSISNCIFSNNRSAYDNMMYVVTDSAQSFIMDSCIISGNNFARTAIFINNFFGGSSHVYGNKVFENTSGNVIFQGAAAYMLLENNEFYSNSSASGTISFTGTTSALGTKDGHATVRGNKIHDNTNTYDAALVCYGGLIDINSNLVCNNQHTAALCADVDGGGGMDLAYNTPGAIDSTFYIVRNNIIANNYSPFHGGGISINDANGIIANNHIVNNRSAAGGAVYIYDDFPIAFKNNIFYGNITSADITSANTPNISGTSTTTVEYDHNWSEHATLFDLDLGTSYVLSGDSTTNVHSADPGLISPTLTASVAESALGANFGLQPASTCINAGDTAGARIYATDYAGNARINGGIVDIGAYEFNPLTLGTSNVMNARNELVLFPNPANDLLTVSCNHKISSISICNLAGQLVFLQGYPASEKVHINVAGFAPGLYVLKLNGRDEMKFAKE